MNHQYSKFKNKAIPYAKVGRRVFGSLFNAETFCSDHGLDVNSAIEYGEIPELKNEVQEIAKYQKAVLLEVLHHCFRWEVERSWELNLGKTVKAIPIPPPMRD